jgi:hypothetical protein
MNTHAVRLGIHPPRTGRVFFPADGTLWSHMRRAWQAPSPRPHADHGELA